MTATSPQQKITALTLADTDRLAELHHAAFPPGEAWSVRQFKDLMAQDSVMARAIVQGGEIVSAVLIQIAADQAEILTLATAPDHRRSGYAAQLLDMTEREMASRGIEIWLLDVAADNAPAINFYQRNGFSTDGHRRGYYKRLDGKRVDAILMSRPMARQGAA